MCSAPACGIFREAEVHIADCHHCILLVYTTFFVLRMNIAAVNTTVVSRHPYLEVAHSGPFEAPHKIDF